MHILKTWQAAKENLNYKMARGIKLSFVFSEKRFFKVCLKVNDQKDAEKKEFNITCIIMDEYVSLDITLTLILFV